MDLANITSIQSTLTRIPYVALTLNSRKAEKCEGAHGWLGSPSELYQFPRAAVTKRHKLSNLKKQKFILIALEVVSLKSRCH